MSKPSQNFIAAAKMKQCHGSGALRRHWKPVPGSCFTGEGTPHSRRIFPGGSFVITCRKRVSESWKCRRVIQVRNNILLLIGNVLGMSHNVVSWFSVPSFAATVADLSDLPSKLSLQYPSFVGYWTPGANTAHQPKSRNLSTFGKS